MNKSDGRITFNGIIPKSALENEYGISTIVFEIDRTISPSSLTSPSDDQKLGLAIDRIEIFKE
ncbi:MAG: hypothetical protein KGI10_03345 [Thaumarchaeota archaeon]|nr:hypothetical protein [Nitrososphaerota archaeon]